MRMASEAEDLQPWTIAVVCSMTALALVSVCLRLLSRYERKQKLWWDDYMIIWSMAWNLLVLALIFGMIHNGMGLHATVVPVAKIVWMAKLLLAAEILYVFNLVWTKLSILLMYYRIFHFPHFKRWAYYIGAFIIAWVICITFLFIFICVPVQKLWYPTLPGRCINQVGTWISNAVSTIASDLATLILPIPQVWKLQLQRSEKIALTIAFSLGFFVIFCSVYRFSVLFTYSDSDPTYTLARTVVWTVIEMSAGIVSACLPTMRPALHFFMRHLGIKGSILPGLFHNSLPSSNTPTPGLTNRSNGAPNNTNLSSGAHARNGSQGVFYRLSEGTGSGRSDGTKSGEAREGIPMDDKLRPDHLNVYSYSVTTGTKNEGEDFSGDEIPLHNVYVRKDFVQVRQ